MTAAPIFDTLLLLALPASGKSEVRRFLRQGPNERCITDYHLGETVQLDDFPYVHFLRVIDDNLENMGHGRLFYASPESSFRDGNDWGTLLRLVSQDYALVRDVSAPAPSADPLALFDRIDEARQDVGSPAVLGALDGDTRQELARRLAGEADRLVTELFGRRPTSLDGKTIVIEFARGGPDGASPPLAPPHGYAYSLAQLSPEILERAAILYIWVTPEESRRKNLARANPDDPGSILHHSCPGSVMLSDYGVCDMTHLLDTSTVPDTVEVAAHGRVFHVPAVRFDNRVDKTTFVRDEPDTWNAADVESLHGDLSRALATLWERVSAA